jgi:hypothetical protein
VATLLHLYCPGLRPADQTPTWEALVALRRGYGFDVVDCPGPDPLDNAKALQRHWGDSGDLLTLEQDIVPTWDHISDLLVCQYPVCAYDFRLSHGVPWSEVPGGTGIGLWKATPWARKAVKAHPQVPQVPWHDLAAMLWERVGPAHVHGPLITHNHRLEV